jgi:phosphoribosylanthranilate isomerase
MKTKICGITNLEDALHAITSGADALGFVFYKQSPRYISIEDAAAIVKQLPPFVEKVALFVNVDANEVNFTCKSAKMTLAQIHFDVDDTFYDALEIPYLRVIRAQSHEDILKHQHEYRLIDAYCESYGGTGKRLNIEWFKDVDCSNIILAGGLNAENVGTLKPYGFYAVDVSSGVEAHKGKKDPLKVSRFIQEASI